MEKGWISELYFEGKRAVRAFDQNPVARELREGEISENDYVFYLKQAMSYVELSPERLYFAGSRLVGRYPGLARAMMQKADEETGHDTWAFRDMRALGRRPQEIRQIPLCDATRALSHWSSFVAEKGNPVGFFGIAFVLEYLAPARGHRIARNLRARSTIPGITSAIRFIAGHAEADTGHVKAIVEAIRIVERQSDIDAILHSARVTSETYPQLLQRANG